MPFEPRPASLKATISFPEVVAFIYALAPGQSAGFDVTLGRDFTVVLTGAPQAPIDWSASNDEVLAIEDDSGPTAKVTATAKGISRIDLKVRDRVIGTLRVTVKEAKEEEGARFDVPAPVKEDLP